MLNNTLLPGWWDEARSSCTQFALKHNWARTPANTQERGFGSNLTTKLDVGEFRREVERVCSEFDTKQGNESIITEFYRRYKESVEAWRHNMTSNLARHSSDTTSTFNQV